MPITVERHEDVQLLGKKGQLTHRRGRAALVPAHIHNTTWRAHLHRLGPDLALTHRVPPKSRCDPRQLCRLRLSVRDN